MAEGIAPVLFLSVLARKFVHKATEHDFADEVVLRAQLRSSDRDGADGVAPALEKIVARCEGRRKFTFALGWARKRVA